MERYRVTHEDGRWGIVDVVTYRHVIREARARGWSRTRVPRGYVLTMPTGRLVALQEVR
ncbi:hypothetical protein ACWDX6_23840 [Streptomyces sp. NPDC003027]